MLNNISFKIKLMVMSVLPMAALIMMLVLVLSELKNTASGVERIYTDRVVPLEDLKVIADDYAVMVIDAINKANAGLTKAEETSEIIESSEQEIAAKWKKYLATNLTPEEEKLAKEAGVLFAKADVAIEKVHHELQQLSGDVTGQLNHLDCPLYADIDSISEKITELVNLQLRVAKEERDLIVSNYEADIVLLTTMAVVVILLLIGFST